MDRGAAFRAEMETELPALLPVASVDLAGSFGSDLGLFKKDTDAEGCARTLLTFAHETAYSSDGANRAPAKRVLTAAEL
jgi:hypothetical protein